MYAILFPLSWGGGNPFKTRTAIKPSLNFEIYIEVRGSTFYKLKPMHIRTQAGTEMSLLFISDNMKVVKKGGGEQNTLVPNMSTGVTHELHNKMGAIKWDGKLLMFGPLPRASRMFCFLVIKGGPSIEQYIYSQEFSSKALPLKQSRRTIVYLK